jgi:predicted acyltransferase
MENKATLRSESLDSLRGLAILMMILSGSIPFGSALPGWMYHAQEPPPTHAFMPNIPGISWVDMVFPFFIFSMGAAIPFAIASRHKRGDGLFNIIGHNIFRWVGLSLFAFFIYYIRPWVITAATPAKWFVCLLGFVLLFCTFIKLPQTTGNKKIEKYLNAGGALFLSLLILVMNSKGLISLSFQDFDIIIMILACISLFGGIIQLVSKGSVVILSAFWALITSMYITSANTESWVTVIWYYSPVPWLLSWEYLKYLMILIPGIWAGNVLRDFYSSLSEEFTKDSSIISLILAITLLSVNIVIVCGLYSRLLVPVFLWSVFALLLSFYLVKKWKTGFNPLIRKLLCGSAFFIISGLIVEPFQGGIKKDPATLSYLVLTGGMAMLMLIVFIIIIDLRKNKKAFFLLTGSGKNAMLAYFTGSNLVVPIFAITGIDSVFLRFSNQPLWQTVKGIAMTLLVAWISAIAAKKRFMFKT